MTVAIEVWSDIACPWCYVGKRRLEAALRDFPEPVSITWRSFELDPSAPAVSDAVPYAERLGKKYGSSAAQAQAMIDRMTDTARADGIDMRFDRIRPGNTFDAHRLLHLAAARGKQDALKERFMRAYLSEGEAIGEPATLTRLASEVGLDADEIAGVLGTDLYASEVRADEKMAREIGIRGVPFFVIGRYGVSGAQPSQVLREALDKALAEAPSLPDGAMCGPDGC